MKKIGLFYGGTTAKTAVVALKIQESIRRKRSRPDPDRRGDTQGVRIVRQYYCRNFHLVRRRTADLLGRVHAGNRIHRHDGQESRPIRARRPRTLSRQFRRWDRHSGGSLYQKQCGTDRFHACQRLPFHPITGR